MSTSQVLACLPLIALSAIATVPLGFLVGTFVRGAYSFTGLLRAHLRPRRNEWFLHAMDRLPSWVQAVQPGTAHLLVGAPDPLGAGG